MQSAMPYTRFQRGLRRLVAVLVGLAVLPAFAITITIKIEFQGEGGKKWGTPEERAAMIAKLKEQLKEEWGQKIKAKRINGAYYYTTPAVDIEVTEGPTDPIAWNEVGVVIHNMDDTDDGDFGGYEYGDNKVHVYPRNMRDAVRRDAHDNPITDQNGNTIPMSSDLVTWVEKTTAHELGHYGCADDNNESAQGEGPPNKMAQSGAVDQWAQAKGKTFDEVNKTRKFREDHRVKQMRNIAKAGPQCRTDKDFYKDSPYVGSVMPLDDPAPEEGGFVNFAISLTGPAAGNYDLGFMNPGFDNLPNTSDDQFITKWLGNNEMLIDWTPDNGIDDPQHFGPVPLDSVVSLFEGNWYAWAVENIGSGEVYPLADYGQLLLSDPESNSILGRTVFGKAELIFDLNRDLTPDLQFILSNDLSTIVGENGLPLYALNKTGTGFTTTPIPEPAVVGLAAIAMLGLTTRKR